MRRLDGKPQVFSEEQRRKNGDAYLNYILPILGYRVIRLSEKKIKSGEFKLLLSI